MAPSNRSCVLLFLSTALVLRPAANSRECLLAWKNVSKKLPGKNDLWTHLYQTLKEAQNPTKSTGTKSNWETRGFCSTPISSLYHFSTSSHFPLCPVVFRSSVRRGKRRYGERMGKGRILTAYHGANLTTTCSKILQTLHVLRCCFFILSKNL